MRSILSGILFVLLSNDIARAAAPSQLLGKSIIVSWTETRMQKWPGEKNTYSTVRAGELRIYVSSAGKIFNRLSMRGRGPGGSSDQVAGGGPDKYENRIVSFQGRSMTQATPMEGGVRRVAADFNDNFSGCTAQVLTGMEAGAKKIVMKSVGSGLPFEIHSIQTSSASCSVQDGNVFVQ